MANYMSWPSPQLCILGSQDVEKRNPRVAARRQMDTVGEAQAQELIRPAQAPRDPSTLELFYDLFLVANLATVTMKNEIVDERSLRAYLGFFTLLWFTWLQTILYDVRVSSESVFHHIHKAVSCAIMMGFVVCAAMYDTSDVHSTINGFKAMSLVLMVSRLALALQYSIVCLSVRGPSKIRTPMLFTAGSLILAAAGFLGVFWGFTYTPHCYLAWYAISATEATSIVLISCRWRIFSFKRTHLLERLGLLTLIIMGEGILGMSRTTYQLFQTVNKPTAENFGELISAVLLVYMIFMLYFGHIEHDKFGTIRQQIWMLLHYPLHVAILLTVEGSSFLVLSGVIGHITDAWGNLYPLSSHPDWNSFFSGYQSANEVVSDILMDMDTLLALTFKDSEALALINLYNYTTDIVTVETIAAPFNSTQWQDEASNAINQLWSGVEVAIYHSFGIEGHDPHDHEPSSIEQAASAQNVMDTVFLYFYFSAGSLLLVLAIMYAFSKKSQSHSREAWASIAARMVVGAGVMLPVMARWIDTDASYSFYLSPWTIAVVMLSYLTGEP
ncbi:hypothetical protein A1O3_09006 [Capronia epimyces CBS 606.96]|uniref:Uncharacterized protein n=1 Tax=Capronia epimyces CBS 606.96 TaxID=1182542 RepID=W9XBM0_9EURO|nr:uncharacterized protein A1O3_09006 [Capronia epimyces CBS 606.96]EXJ77847.1 hypothetical protein A1O3_09006 [Capronia epimyces CBS 606.96]